MENYNKLITKQSQSTKEKRDENMRDGAFYGSVTLQDLVAPKDPKHVKNTKAEAMKGYLTE